MIVLGTLLTPISAISLLMILAGGYGTSTFDPVGFFIVVILPAGSVVTGILLVRRRPWGWYGAVGIMGFLLAMSGWELVTAKEGMHTTTSPSGLQTTVMTSGPGIGTFLMVLISAALLVGLLRRNVREECGIDGALKAAGPADRIVSVPAPVPMPSDPHANWRVGHIGRDRMYYDENRSGNWSRIEIDGEMLTGRAHHVIYFASPSQWATYPEWARDRREEIIARIKSEFRPPDYEYYNETGEPPAAGVSVAPSVAPVSLPQPLRATPSQRRALVVAIVVLLCISGGMGWLVATGIGSNSTYFPSKRASQQRTVSREAEPVMFWASISIYSAIGLATGGMALWLIREGMRKDL